MSRDVHVLTFLLPPLSLLDGDSDWTTVFHTVGAAEAAAAVNTVALQLSVLPTVYGPHAFPSLNFSVASSELPYPYSDPSTDLPRSRSQTLRVLS